MVSECAQAKSFSLTNVKKISAGQRIFLIKEVNYPEKLIRQA
jgi:hypothetical protein